MVENKDFFWQKFSVAYDYPVCFARGIFREDNTTFRSVVVRREPEKLHRVLVVLDEGLDRVSSVLRPAIEAYFRRHSDVLKLVAPIITAPGGERAKTDRTLLDKIQNAIFDHRIDRHSFVVAIGGGAVLDAVGFAAATSHRGVRHIRVPSTTLAQCDSAVGVKNAVNMKGVKNYLGTFAPPWAVLCDLDFLDTLPITDRIAGHAEAVKVALIRDQTLFEDIGSHATQLIACDPETEERIIRRSAELHMIQIAHGGDPFEMGSARPLDFGHWSAHKLESLTNHSLSHGAAVAIGVALDTRYSVLAGYLPDEDGERVIRLLETLGFQLWHPALDQRTPSGELSVLLGIEDFREHLGGQLTITMLQGLGSSFEINSIDSALVVKALSWLRDRSANVAHAARCGIGSV